MLLSVVVPTYRRASALIETLDSLANQTERDFEVIVVSDGPDTDTRILSETYKPDFSIRWVFHEQNLGLAAARNTGANAARGELLVFLDDDTPGCADLLGQHAQRHLQEAPGPGTAVWGRIVEDRKIPPQSCTDKHLQRSWERTLRDFQPTLEASGFASIGAGIERAICFGVNCSIRREVFARSSGFNTKLRHLDEEMEFGHRLYISGVRFFFEPLAVVRHRNTKNVTAYYRSCWRLKGVVDVARVYEFGQRNQQTQTLGTLHRGWLPGRLVARTFWRHNRKMKRLASGLEAAANRTGSRLLAGAWAKVCDKTEYWDGVKSNGCTPEGLREVSGAANAILCLHSISEPKSRAEASYYISPRKFHSFMRRFRANGHTSVTLDQWIAGGLPEKHSLVTFDDAYDDLYDRLLPAIDQYRLNPVIFLVAGRIGATNLWDQNTKGLRSRSLLGLQQLREMQKLGITFGCHTLTHPWLPHTTDAELRAEVIDSKSRLEDMFGVEMTSFAYPYGGVDQRVRATVAEAGYKMAFTMLPGLNWWNDPLCQTRADVREQTTFLDFSLQLRSGCSLGQWAAAQAQTLGQDLPSPGLRNAVRSFEKTARRVQTVLRRGLDPQRHTRVSK